MVKRKSEMRNQELERQNDRGIYRMIGKKINKWKYRSKAL